jgi:putative two-component system response regulator
LRIPVSGTGLITVPDQTARTSPAVAGAPRTPSPFLPQLPATGRALIVDDDVQVSDALRRLLREAGLGTVITTADPTQAAALFARHEPDVVLLDLHMPGLDGFEVLALLRDVAPSGVPVPIVMLTGDSGSKQKLQALAGGATDFLVKPIDVMEVILRVRALLHTRELQRELADQNRTLEVRIAKRTRQLEVAQMEMLERLASAAELRDDDTGQHIHRVGQLAGRLALALGWTREQAELLDHAARLHDIGKIGIPDSILRKPGPLTPEEFEQMKSHTVVGARLLAGGQSELIQMAERVALDHHERWDGAGYPNKLAGDAIPLEARIVAVADFFDALTHERPYRAAFPVERTLAMVRSSVGSHFDPRVGEAFFGLGET